MNESSKVRPHLYPDLRDWPIYKLHQHRDRFLRELEQESYRNITRENPDLVELLQSVIYKEKVRSKKNAWQVDPPDEVQWWRETEKRLIEAGLDPDDPQELERRAQVLRLIIHRYAEEIVGSFKISTFQFARRFLTMLFNRLLNSAASTRFRRIWGGKARLRDKLIVRGEVDKVRQLMLEHNVVVLPTHFSNLDSLLIGYALDGFAGLPQFSFGAGLNLLNADWAAYFINRFGAYRVDRRKKNPVYLEVLKSFSRLAIYQGVNSIFFPGGTRSRSGSIEETVKYGLLSTTVEAQRRLLQEGSDKKVIVVPLVISYHFVLEAKFLIQEYLRRKGREQYLGAKSSQFTYSRFLRFMWQLFSSSSEIYLNLGQPMDVLGNPVRADGTSLDRDGQAVDLMGYFEREGKIQRDPQREREYTRILGDAVIERFHRDNVVLTSHLVAYTAFRILEQFHADTDLFGVLRLVEDDFVFDMDLMLSTLVSVREELFRLEQEGLIQLSPGIRESAEDILRDGIKNMAIYHDKKPLFLKKDRLQSQDFHLLYYYHNRMMGYPTLGPASIIQVEGDVRKQRVSLLRDNAKD